MFGKSRMIGFKVPLSADEAHIFAIYCDKILSSYKDVEFKNELKLLEYRIENDISSLNLDDIFYYERIVGVFKSLMYCCGRHHIYLSRDHTHLLWEMESIIELYYKRK